MSNLRVRDENDQLMSIPVRTIRMVKGFEKGRFDDKPEIQGEIVYATVRGISSAFTRTQGSVAAEMVTQDLAFEGKLIEVALVPGGPQFDRPQQAWFRREDLFSLEPLEVTEENRASSLITVALPQLRRKDDQGEFTEPSMFQIFATDTTDEVDALINPTRPNPTTQAE